MAFLDRLRGRRGRDGAAVSGRSSVAGTAPVFGAAQASGGSSAADGLPASAAAPAAGGSSAAGGAPAGPAPVRDAGAVAADGGAGPVPAAAPVVLAAWTGLPPLRPATGERTPGVADAGFGGRLPTWQNPSFTRAPSPSVLDPAAGHGLLSAALTEGPRWAPYPWAPTRPRAGPA
ncbi:hypothetical protein AB0O29_28995, partial [Streptomyces sp. NPDC089915]